MLEYAVGDRAICSAHGVGRIERIESKCIAGSHKDFYVVKVVSSGAVLMIPTDGCRRAGMRDVISSQKIEEVFKLLKEKPEVTTRTWNRRFREYNERLRTGSIFDVARVLRDLSALKQVKELSFGEKGMFEKAQLLMVSEISLASGRSSEDVLNHINQSLCLN